MRSAPATLAASVSERALQVLGEAFAAFNAWQQSQSARDQAEFGQKAREEVIRLAAAHRELEDALRSFVGGDQSRPVMRADGLLTGGSSAQSWLSFAEHARRMSDLRNALAATAYVVVAGDKYSEAIRRRINLGALQWTHCAADHWMRAFEEQPTRSGDFGRALSAFSERQVANRQSKPPELGSAALDSVLCEWARLQVKGP
jgi:hypothetical protein